MTMAANDYSGPPTSTSFISQDVRLPICAQQFHMARAALGLTYRDIHAATGVATSTLVKIGRVPVTPRIMQKLRKFFEGLGIGFARASNGVRGVYFIAKPAPKATAATVSGPSPAKRKLDEPFTPEANSVDFL